MGGGYNTPITTAVIPEPEVSCGIKAVEQIYNLYTNLTFIEREITRLNFSLDSTLDHKQLTQIIKKLTSAVADYRYFSNERYSKVPFTKYHNGVVALKFHNSISTHWLAVIGGKFIDDSKEVSYPQLKRRYPNLDGFGHTVLYLKRQEAITLNSLRKEKCDRQNCAACYRSTNCRSYHTPSKLLKRKLDA